MLQYIGRAAYGCIESESQSKPRVQDCFLFSLLFWGGLFFFTTVIRLAKTLGSFHEIPSDCCTSDNAGGNKSSFLEFVLFMFSWLKAQCVRSSGN